MYKKILVPINSSPTAEAALQEAIKLADGKAEILLFYVLEDFIPIAADGYDYASNTILQENNRKTAEDTLALAAEKVRRSGCKVDTVLLDEMSLGVVDAINSEARNWSADLIVIGTHGRSGLTRLLLGSIAEEVVREANVPVLLVRA